MNLKRSEVRARTQISYIWDNRSTQFRLLTKMKLYFFLFIIKLPPYHEADSLSWLVKMFLRKISSTLSSNVSDSVITNNWKP